MEIQIVQNSLFQVGDLELDTMGALNHLVTNHSWRLDTPFISFRK